jgi:hypothetical protein
MCFSAVWHRQAKSDSRGEAEGGLSGAVAGNVNGSCDENDGGESGNCQPVDVSVNCTSPPTAQRVI